MEWEPVIGLEVHVQLLTQSKIFSGASTMYGAEPNTQACAIDLGLPGVLPVLNQQAVRLAIHFGLAVNATIAPYSLFARKNYFYPDLPKGYQISQYDLPIVVGGTINISLEDGTNKDIALTRAHLEEDAGKSVHDLFPGLTGIDLNRAGTPLLEIVSEPQLRSAKEAVAYLKALHLLVRELEISDGNMQEGSFRCDANVSVRRKGNTQLGTRTEIKNVNSFRFVERAIDFEIERHIDLLESGKTVIQETRLYDSDKNETRSMRGKEEAHDYRYFPDPDLLPIVIEAELIAEIRAQLPELPTAKKQRFIEHYGITAYDADLLILDRHQAEFFEDVAKLTKAPAKLAANWINSETITQSPITPQQLATLLDRIHDGTISGKIAKTVFDALCQQQGDVDTIIQQQGLIQITDSNELEQIIKKIIGEYSEQAEQYRAGKEKIFGFFVGKVMQATQGKANPQKLNELLKSCLSN